MLNTFTLAQAREKITAKEISAPEVTSAVLSVIREKNPELNVYLAVDETAVSESDKLSELPLAGLPIAVKDNFCTTTLPTTASSTVLDGFVSPYVSTAIKKLTTAGGVVIGKTNLDAWAHGSSTETSQFGRTLNPRNPEHLPGGSSGGSAAAVAGDLCIASLGTETAGSIRQPAAWCGVVGLKPTYGRVSRAGIVAMGSSLDSPGPITKTVEDAAILLEHIAGQDKYDGTTAPKAVPKFTDALSKTPNGLRVGVLYRELPGLEVVRPHLEKVAAVMSELGCEVADAEAISPKHAIAVYTVVQRAEVSSNLARYDGIRYGSDRSHFGAEAKRRIMLGTYTLSKGYADQYYNTAQKVRSLYRADFAKLFSQYDVLISISSPGFAKKVGATEGAAMFGELEDMLLEPSSLTGLPGINVPCYRDPETNLYLGLNIMAPHWREDLCIQVANAYERATEWNSWRNSA